MKMKDVVKGVVIGVILVIAIANVLHLFCENNIVPVLSGFVVGIVTGCTIAAQVTVKQIKASCWLLLHYRLPRVFRKIFNTKNASILQLAILSCLLVTCSVGVWYIVSNTVPLSSDVCWPLGFISTFLALAILIAQDEEKVFTYKNPFLRAILFVCLAILLGIGSSLIIPLVVILFLYIIFIKPAYNLIVKHELATVVIGVIIGGTGGLAYGWTYMHFWATLSAMLIGVGAGLLSSLTLYKICKAIERFTAAQTA